MTFARHRAAVLLLLLFADLAAAVWWARLGIPHELVAAPTGRIACVSYAPYRKPGESPFTPGYMVTAERIDEDLKALSRRFDCVRTYSVGQGLDQVPAIARRYGMKVLLGAWLSRNEVENAEELSMAIAVARRERDVIRAIVVGNEVLLRGELPQRTIASHLRAVRAATGLPVTYADVWEFWLKYREVAPAVDFITIHILPYWEDEPIPIESAVAHVDAIYQKMQAAFPGREFLIGETGWPSAGRQRWRSIPSLVNEARFFREFMNFVEVKHLPYNVIEAFDQPWKRKLEGTVGGYWGLYDDELRDKFALSGPVVEDPRWWIGWLAGVVGAFAFVVVGRLLRGASSPWSIAVLGLMGFFAVAMGMAEVRHFTMANRDLIEWVSTVTATVVSVATAWHAASRVARWIDGDVPTPASMPMAEALSLRVRGRVDERISGALQGFWLFVAMVINLLLVFDARYRDFPSLLFAPAVVAFAMIAVTRLGGRIGAPTDIEERMLAAGLVVSAAVIVVMELPINLASDLWALLCVLFAAAVCLNRSPARDPVAPAPGPVRRS